MESQPSQRRRKDGGTHDPRDVTALASGKSLLRMDGISTPALWMGYKEFISRFWA
jgi:hypothetical protein